MAKCKPKGFHSTSSSSRFTHAMMLLDRAARDDRDRAQMLLNKALETYTEIGMPRHVEMIQQLLARAADP